jgi:hypothetical protein
MEFQEFIDYEGPTGLFVATGSSVLPFDSAEGISAVAQSAMLTSLGSSPEAKKYATAMQKSLRVAHDLDAS